MTTSLCFGQLLREFRLRSGVTQEELARLSGVSARTVSMLETGKRNAPRVASARLLADAMSLQVDERESLLAATRVPAVEAGSTDEVPASPAPSTGRNDSSAPARCLPYAVPDFVGRESELERLFQLAADSASGAVRISTIDGMAGVGKTALALHAGHALASEFPDGLLYYDLRGFRSDSYPQSSEEALRGLLRMVGFPSRRIPVTLDSKAAAWRDAVAGKRMLVVLDDAADVDQVRPLLPGTAGSFTLITSRSRMPALDGATPLSLDVLPPVDAITLFARIAGTRSGSNLEKLSEIAELCDRLPLAIRILAARLAHRPEWTVEYLAKQLRKNSCRLAELKFGDGQGVATALDVSYRRLDVDQRRLFRLLGVHPAVEVDAGLASSLAEISPERAENLLEVMVDQHVVLQPAPGRYRLRNLMRALAKMLVRDSDVPREAEFACGRASPLLSPALVR